MLKCILKKFGDRAGGNTGYLEVRTSLRFGGREINEILENTTQTVCLRNWEVTA
jgi:hypothetical protein